MCTIHENIQQALSVRPALLFVGVTFLTKGMLGPNPTLVEILNMHTDSYSVCKATNVFNTLHIHSSSYVGVQIHDI